MNTAAEYVPELDARKVAQVADQWVYQSARVQPREHVVVIYDFAAYQLARMVASRCLKLGARVTVRVSDPEMGELITRLSSDQDIYRADMYANLQTLTADVVFVIRAQTRLDAMSSVNAGRMALLSDIRRWIQDYRVNYTRWQLILWPTPAEAAFEGLSFEEYADLWMAAADQPWDEIEAAQDYFVQKLDAGKQLTLIANPLDADVRRRTELTMSIEGMTFINSTIDNNYPGSEVFSSPVRESVNGQLFAAGTYSYNGRLYEDIWMRVERGKIVEARAEKYDEELQKLLNTDEGARYFGEVAFGTNPALRRRLLNGLLNEKVGGSFHITPGKAYDDTIADGKHVNNGNRSAIHWDITILMLPQYGGGEIRIDGEVIQKDGRFTDPQMTVLNTGL